MASTQEATDMKITGAALLAVVMAIALLPTLDAAGTSCESLLKLAAANTTVTAAEQVPAGGFRAPGAGGSAQNGSRFAELPAFCRVAATVKPTADSDIKIEVWMPASGWNGKFQAVGNGGWNGNVDQNALATALRRGYATASTDTGHEGGAGPWMQNKEKVIDYGYRAVHEMTATAKSLITAFYGNPAKLSYFNGCSA